MRKEGKRGERPERGERGRKRGVKQVPSEWKLGFQLWLGIHLGIEGKKLLHSSKWGEIRGDLVRFGRIQGHFLL